MQKSPQTREELKEFWIKKLHAEIGFRTNKIVSCHIAMVTLRVCVEKFKGGNIANCFEKWANITQDQFVLYILKFGLTMEFAEVPVCQFVPSWNFSPAETEIIDAEIFKLNGVIVNTPDHVSETFWRTKKNGGFRMILNLNQTFNGFLKFKHCKLESVEDALDLTTECCYFMPVELKDASYTISIHQNYQKILRLFWKEEYYDYVVLTNGFSSESLQMF